MRFITLSHRFSSLIDAAGLLIVVTVCGVYYVGWQRNLNADRQSERSEIARLERLLKNSAGLLDETRRLDTELHQLRVQASSARDRIPPRPNEAELLRMISNAAKQTGIAILDYRRHKAVDQKTHSQFQVTVSVRGDYRSLCRFLNDLDSMPRLTQIASMDIAPAASEAHQLQVEIKLDVYFGIQPRATTRTGAVT